MTIPSTNTKLLVTEDWTKVYKSFRNADFQSYDFETIRRILISYLQENYPEDFNDFIDSSEYIALVDLIAYLGQNLSFRIDLNARENFLETAQRRDSILRLAQLISYVPKRNVPASGLLKITAISTTDSIFDSSGSNLANTTVAWNDSSNPNWYEQFVTIMNSAMPGGNVFGKPNDRNTIGGILTEQYKINSSTTDVPIFGFSKNINGTGMTFEIVPATFHGKPFIYEADPKPGSQVSFLYQNDNKGSGSDSTGFFAYFKQGSLGLTNFTITKPVPNEIIGVNVDSINDTDVWLWQLNPDGTYPVETWTKVPSVVGNNVIYNSLNAGVRNLFSVTSRDSDQIDLTFTDGSFGNLPKGDFVLFYRQSNGLTYSIKPEQLSGVVVTIPYYTKSGQSQTLTVTLGLQYTVSNSSGPESNASIQQKAPQTYYTQNRMITGEDYNIAPLTLTNNILKVKSINRTSSGVSKYFDLSDVSTKYSSTNIFATDGIVYKESFERNFSFSYASRNDIFAVFKKQLEPIISSVEAKTFYLDKYRTGKPVLINRTTDDITVYNYSTPLYQWHLTNIAAGQGTGYIYSHDRNNNVDIPQSIGTYVSNVLKYITTGSLIKFVPPNSTSGAKQYFLPNGKIVPTKTTKTVDYIWSTILQVVADGSNLGLGNLSDGTGPVILSNRVGQGSIPVEIIPAFVRSVEYAFENDIANLCLTQKNFGLRFASDLRSWKVIENTNLNLLDTFSFDHEGDTSNANKDSSWMIAFTWTGADYKVRYRFLNYIFQSINQTGFYIDKFDVNFDYTTNTVIKDKINVLSINTMPNQNPGETKALGFDYSWQIDGTIVELDGYVDPSRVRVSFYNHQDSGAVGQIIDPDSFYNVVGNPVYGTSDGFVMFKLTADNMGYTPVNSEQFIAFNNETDARLHFSNILDVEYLYYFKETNSVKSVNSMNEFIYEPSYIVYQGRRDLNFHYIHNSGEERRIDPSKSNIIDVFMLTSDYDLQFRNWLITGTGDAPKAPSSQSLENNYSGVLEPIKSVSDELIYQPVKYKVLFGSSADINLQATFKAVQSPTSTASINDIRSRILSAINQFFALENWDFGQSFYFSELTTYVMNIVTPDITNFVIVPTVNNFGSLYEVACQSNEIFISGAQASDISVIDAITASQLNTQLIITNAG
jgi:hypothetical protein